MTNKEIINSLLIDFIGRNFDICAVDVEKFISDRERLINDIDAIYNPEEYDLEIDLKTGKYKRIPDDFYQEVNDVKSEMKIDEDKL